MPQQKSIDRQVLDSLNVLDTPGKPNLAKELIHLFLNQAPMRIEAITLLFGQNQLEKLALEAHTLKTSSAYVGATNLSEICKELEIQANKRENGPIVKLVAELHQEFDRVRQELITISESSQ